MNKKCISQEQSKEIMLSMLDAINDLCKKNNIQYFLTGGTLLGAIRHKGFIPWDDDIDIILLKDDFEKLINVIKEQKDYPWLGIVDWNNEGYYYPFPKVVDNRTIAKQADNTTEYGIWIDVFPFGNFPDDEKQRVSYMKSCQLWRDLILSMTTDFSNVDFSIKTVVKFLMKTATFLLGKRRVGRWALANSRKFDNTETKFVGSIFTPYKHEYIEKDKLFPIEYKEFEGRKLPIPACWDEYLTHMYGDYMKMPPVDKRRTHRITAWWK